MKQHKSTRDRANITPEEAEQIADTLKERIYATITLIALLATLWQSAEHFTARGAAFSVFGTVLALWLAIGIASRMSYQVVHGRRMDARAYGQILRSRSGLLAPAVPVLVLIGIAGLGLMNLQTALLISLIVSLLSFAAFSLIAGRRIHTTWTSIVTTTCFELLLGIGIIAIKVVAGH